MPLRRKGPTEVLFVEDSAGDALLTGQIVAEYVRPPKKLVIARDGIQALMMLSDPAFEPVLIILDLSLPMVSGLEVLERNPRKDIPVVIFSASFNDSDVDRAFASGALAYVQKPMDFVRYKNAVLEIIDKWALPEKEANGASTS
jgi:CheY-like chemotaxis protein